MCTEMDNKTKGFMWFICKDAAPLSESGIFFRTLKQAQYFQNKGYDVKIICSDWVHNTDICHQAANGWASEVHDGVEYIFVKSLYYGKSNVKRLVSYVLFARSIFKLVKVMQKPDVIVHTSRIPFDYQIYKFAKKCRAKYIMDVSDLWPWELEHGGILGKNNPLLEFFYSIEKKLYSKADHVVFSVEGGPDYVCAHGWDKQGHNGPIDLNKIHYVNTGLDYKEFVERQAKYVLDDQDLCNPDTFKVVYLGSIRPANDVRQLVEAARCLKDNESIKILIYGNGPEREPLEKLVESEHLTNVLFKDNWVKPEYVPFILSHASLNLLNYMKGWAPYGGSMNKMFMAMASGKPILCNAGMGYSPIRKYNIGVDQYFATSQEYAEAIASFAGLSQEEYQALCERCKAVAADFNTFDLVEQFEKYCDL